jgi:hypothetical protein
VPSLVLPEGVLPVFLWKPYGELPVGSPFACVGPVTHAGLSSSNAYMV